MLRQRLVSRALQAGLALALWVWAPAPSDVLGQTETILSLIGSDDAGATQDVTATWLPEPGRSIRLVTNPPGLPINLVEAQTTRHPGICTNYGDLNNTGLDFTLIGDVLTAHDCGGTAVVDVGGQLVKLPRDDNNNGLADVWESQFGGGLAPGDDRDLPPTIVDDTQVSPDLLGDGISLLDESRGFLVSPEDPAAGTVVTIDGVTHKHIRTDPRRKDLFVLIVPNQCTPSGSLSPPLGTFTRYFPPGGPSLMAAMNTLVPGNQIHPLALRSGTSQSDQWADFFDHYSLAEGRVWRDANDQPTTSEPALDRSVNRGALIPIPDPATNSPVQKGLRIIECQVRDTSSTLGIASWGTPNRSMQSTVPYADNGVVYPDRIRRDINSRISAGGPRTVRWRTYDPTANRSRGAWVERQRFSPPSTAEDPLVAAEIQYVVAMEIVHSTQLNPEAIAVNKITYTYHYEPGHGSNLDQNIVQTIDSKTSGFNTFDIPSTFLTQDQSQFRLRH